MFTSVKEEVLWNYVNECIIYDKSSGDFIWRGDRPREHFADYRSYRIWTSRLGGESAGTISTFGYLYICINFKRYRAHRLAFFLEYKRWPSGVLDHIDGDRLNNEISNLREVSVSVNSRNMKRNILNTSGYNGVSWDKTRGKYIAQGSITTDGVRKKVFLGRYKEFEDAVKARKEWEDSEGNFTERHGK